MQYKYREASSPPLVGLACVLFLSDCLVSFLRNLIMMSLHFLAFVGLASLALAAPQDVYEGMSKRYNEVRNGVNYNVFKRATGDNTALSYVENSGICVSMIPCEAWPSQQASYLTRRESLRADDHKGDHSRGDHILGIPRRRSEFPECDAHVVLVFRGAQLGKHCTSNTLAEFVFPRTTPGPRVTIPWLSPLCRPGRNPHGQDHSCGIQPLRSKNQAHLEWREVILYA